MQTQSVSSRPPKQLWQDVSECKWDAAMDHIKDACSSETFEQLVPMVELLISKLLQQAEFQDLLSTYLPLMESMQNIPEHLQASLGVATQVATKDLRGDLNFDNVISALKNGQKDVVLRVFFTDTSGRFGSQGKFRFSFAIP